MTSSWEAEVASPTIPPPVRRVRDRPGTVRVRIAALAAPVGVQKDLDRTTVRGCHPTDSRSGTAPNDDRAPTAWGALYFRSWREPVILCPRGDLNPHAR